MAASNWQRFFTNQNNAVFYYDQSTLKPSADLKTWTMWMKTDTAAAKDATPTVVRKATIDCQAEHVVLGSGVMYPKAGGSLPVEAVAKPIPIVPDTVLSALFDTFCKDEPETPPRP